VNDPELSGTALATIVFNGLARSSLAGESAAERIWDHLFRGLPPWRADPSMPGPQALVPNLETSTQAGRGVPTALTG
jgi:hypothetical protein